MKEETTKLPGINPNEVKPVNPQLVKYDLGIASLVKKIFR